jgi:serine/threonine-protein phosphatase PGAM5
MAYFGKQNGSVRAFGAAVGSAMFAGLVTYSHALPVQSEGKANTKSEDEAFFHGQCFQRQVWKPSLQYPAWDYNWDGRETNTGGMTKTRHIILVRHGQYEMKFPNDKERVLTPLGRLQAEYTGRRLAAMASTNDRVCRNGDEKDTFASPCCIKSIRVSDMERAKETAEIIASQIRGGKVQVSSPDPLLNEALPAPILPVRPDVGSLRAQAEEIDKNHDRIEAAFQKYIHRADDNSGTEHEFEIIVCHANVIRYFLFRALQLPPEAWLRVSLFNCSLTYLMIQPNGYVTARLVGDSGHIPYEETTFSGAYGYNWKAPTST